jgi:HAD superfamily hydrolase (TIGR01549 family)
MFEPVNTIFFDVGNTLYISPDMEKEYPRQLLELIANTRGVDLAQAKEVFSKIGKKYPNKVGAMEELGYTRAQVHEAFCKVDPRKYLSRDPELVLMMGVLASNYALGIISNFKQSHLEEILDVLGLSKDLFRWFVTEDIVQEIKPAPEPFLKALEMSTVSAYQCLYVGDDPTKDMRPAKEIGMATVLVRRNPSEEDMKYADTSIEDVKQLTKLLSRTQSHSR